MYMAYKSYAFPSLTNSRLTLGGEEEGEPGEMVLVLVRGVCMCVC